MQQSIVKCYCFFVQTLLNMFRALLCPSSGARQTAVAASGFRMNVEVEVFSAVVGLLVSVRQSDKILRLIVASSWVFYLSLFNLPLFFLMHDKFISYMWYNLNIRLKCPDHQNKLNLGPFSSDFHFPLASLYRHTRLWYVSVPGLCDLIHLDLVHELPISPTNFCPEDEGSRFLPVTYTEAFNLNSQGLWGPHVCSEEEGIIWKPSISQEETKTACEDM